MVLKTLIGVCLGGLIGRAIRHDDGHGLLLGGVALIALCVDAYQERRRA